MICFSRSLRLIPERLTFKPPHLEAIDRLTRLLTIAEVPRTGIAATFMWQKAYAQRHLYQSIPRGRERIVARQRFAE